MAQDEAREARQDAPSTNLRGRKLVDRAALQLGHSPTSRSTWVGGGPLWQPRATERKRIEYRITVRRTINGIELANAGVRIAVHASGRVSALRFGGVRVASRVRRQARRSRPASGRWLERQSGQPCDLQARFDREVVPPNVEGKSRVVAGDVRDAREQAQRGGRSRLYVVSYSLEVTDR